MPIVVSEKFSHSKIRFAEAKTAEKDSSKKISFVSKKNNKDGMKVDYSRE